MEDIAITGTGGFAKEIVTLIASINRVEKRYNLIGFIDDKLPKGTLINGIPVLGNDNEINTNWKTRLALVIAVGDPLLKKKIREKYNNTNIVFPSIIHPTAILGDEKYIRIGKGCIICAQCILTTNIVLEDFVTLNIMATVGHDTVIKSYSSFMPSVNISGEVVVHELVYVGTGAKIINLTEIGAKTIIGAGAVVAKNIPANCTAVGIPAKPIKYHER